MSGLIQNIELSGSEFPKLAGLREKGKQSFLRQQLPTAKTESYKYTRIRGLDTQDYIIEQAVECGCGHDCCCHENKILPFDSHEIKFCNGVLTHDHFHLPDGIEAMSLLDAVFDDETVGYLNKSFDMEALPFAALNTAYLEQGIFLRIQKNVHADKPIALIYHTDGHKKTFNNIRNIFVLENEAKVEIIEYFYYDGEPKSEYFNNIVNEIYIGRNAALQYYKKQDEAFKAVHIALNAVRVKENARFESYCFQSGADLARHETKISLREKNASTRVNAAYVMNGWATIDTTTDISHFAPQTFSRQLVKGVVGGQARGVFQGKIHIAPNAVKTEGYQLHKAMLLSDTAEIDVKPELEIYADDVKCSHGAAGGEPDPEQLFYLRSRGIGEEEARKLLIDAFVLEAFENLENEDLRQWILKKERI